jgi:ABC-type amino acid transport substrate-binding protein
MSAERIPILPQAPLRHAKVFRLFLIALFAAGLPVCAIAQKAGSQEHRQMVVATHEAPPFAILGQDGQWHGIAIDLWRKIADERGYDYRFVQSDLTGMIDGVVDGRYDASVGALTITADRESKVDFTHPFYATGFGIAVPTADPAWYTLFSNFFTIGFLKAVLALSAVLVIVGLLFWLAERKRNPEQFAPDATGIGAGFWFSAVTMTTVGYGDKAPRTAAGKAIALVWMFAAILIISTFTGMIASSLTAGRLEGAVKGPDDLPGARVGSIAGSATDQWLGEEQIGFRSFTDIEAGLVALRKGRLDAFVYDEPLLRYLIRTSFSGELRMLPGTFGRQNYGIALPQGSALREPIDVSLLRIVEGGNWRASIRNMLGERK